MWWGDIAPGQTPTGAYSLVYDTDPLTEGLEILGLPRQDQHRFVAWSEAINHGTIDEQNARRAADEMAAYEASGLDAIRSLADQIRYRPNAYWERNVRGVHP